VQDGPKTFGRYAIELPLTEGPLGRLLVARDPTLDRRVVVKALRDDLELSPEARTQLVARVRARARAIGALPHPAFAPLHDAGEDASGSPYLVFEFIQGPTLTERLATGPLAPAEVVPIARTLGAALAHAHATGFVHGDVHPDNVILSTAGPRLTDSGFAPLAKENAPTPADDQLGLAQTLYHALTGKKVTDLAARLPPSVAAPHLRSFPHIDTIFERAFAPDPRKRFSSCDVLGNVVATEIEGLDASGVARASASSIVPRATRRWQNAAAGIAVLVIVALVVLGRPRPPPGDGVSLRGVAGEFASAVGTVRPAPVHRPHPPPSASPGTSAPAASSVPPSDTPRPGDTAAPASPTTTPLDSSPAIDRPSTLP
jgi:serine/threonine protein kinase